MLVQLKTSICRHQDPFEEYKARLAKKLAKRTEAEANAKSQTPAPKPQMQKKGQDDVNWFGVKVGTANAASGSSTVGGGVGKYMAAKKRPPETDPASTPMHLPETKQKKRKLGFSNDFEGW
jgi:peptidyl-prolyl cis-trans isomerase-like 2